MREAGTHPSRTGPHMSPLSPLTGHHRHTPTQTQTLTHTHTDGCYSSLLLGRITRPCSVRTARSALLSLSPCTTRSGRYPKKARTDLQPREEGRLRRRPECSAAQRSAAPGRLSLPSAPLYPHRGAWRDGVERGGAGRPGGWAGGVV